MIYASAKVRDSNDNVVARISVVLNPLPLDATAADRLEEKRWRIIVSEPHDTVPLFYWDSSTCFEAFIGLCEAWNDRGFTCERKFGPLANEF